MKNTEHRNFYLFSFIMTPFTLIACSPIRLANAPIEENPVSPVLFIFIVSMVLGVFFFLLSRFEIKKRTAKLSAENKKTKKLLNVQSSLLEAANQELSAIAYRVSHDLRSPLRSIMAYTEILMREYGDQLNEDGRLYQDRVRVNAERLDLFIEGILAYSNLSRQEMNQETVSLTDLANQVISELDSELRGREIKITVQEDLPEVTADRVMLRVVYTHLIKNAIKFTAMCSPAEILVGFSNKQDQDIYFVQDNGIGLDMENSDLIFQPFHRLHGVDQYQGSGIGLALVKRIVSRHGGRVWVEGEEGKGAVFNFTLGEYNPEEGIFSQSELV